MVNPIKSQFIVDFFGTLYIFLNKILEKKWILLFIIIEDLMAESEGKMI